MKQEKNDSQLDMMRHSASHVMAAAVKQIYGDKVKFAIGPNIDDGFYYDFDLGDQTISESDFKEIEKKMKHIIKQNLKFEREEVDIKTALEKVKDQPYKQELIKDLEKEGETKVSFYKLGDIFEDLCAGHHLESSGKVKVFKLLKVAGAYWRGDEKNKMLQRIYGTVFESQQDLDDYLKMQEEAASRDHRKIGKELDLFVFSDLVGKGLPLLTPKGSIIRYELEKFIIEEERRRGYQMTYTPDLAKVDLYKKSGHWDHYQDSMYPAINIDGEDYVLRPMTCPHQFMIYNSRPRSYRELPLRYAEMAKLYRKEQSGELSGLIRVMSFTLNDAHIICRPDQLEIEFAQVIELVQYALKVLGIKKYSYRFSKWDPKDKEKYIDNPQAWEGSQSTMKKILDKMKLDYTEADGEAAFYGPKLDVQLTNVNGKEETAFTIQIDFALPDKFEMVYTDEKGEEQRPMVIHRSGIGCIERTMAFLIEQYAGAFPLWLSPVQVKILPVSDKFLDYATEVKQMLFDQKIRVELDDSAETLGKKIRNGEQEKVPYLLVIGEKEVEAKKVAVRKRGQGDLGQQDTDEFIEQVKKEIEDKVI